MEKEQTWSLKALHKVFCLGLHCLFQDYDSLWTEIYDLHPLQSQCAAMVNMFRKEHVQWLKPWDFLL